MLHDWYDEDRYTAHDMQRHADELWMTLAEFEKMLEKELKV